MSKGQIAVVEYTARYQEGTRLTECEGKIAVVSDEDIRAALDRQIADLARQRGDAATT